MIENRPASGKPCPAFRAVHDPAWFFPSAGHSQAVRVLFHGAESGHRLTLLTGETGTGKTLSMRVVAAELRNEFTVGWIDATKGALRDPLATVPAAFGLKLSGAGAGDVLLRMQEFLGDQNRQGRPAILFVDDAHLCGPNALEDLRGLSDPGGRGAETMPLLMAGAPHLRARLTDPQHRGLYRLISGYFDLPPLGVDEARAYIDHRFAVACCECHAGVSPFEHGSVRVLHHWADGVPEEMNELARYCLRQAQAASRDRLDADFVDTCLRERGLKARPGVGVADRQDLPSVEPGQPVVELPVRAAATPTTAPPTSAVPRHEMPPATGADQPVTTARSLPVLTSQPVRTKKTASPWPGLSRAALVLAIAGAAGALYWWQIRERNPDLTTISDIDTQPAQLRPEPDDLPPSAFTQFAKSPELPPPAQVERMASMPDPAALMAEALFIGQDQPEDAALLYERAAIHGNARAAYYLGQAFEIGEGVNADPNRARSWYETAEGIWGATDRLEGLSEQPVVQAAASAPIPVLQAVLPSGQLELHWRAAQGESPATFAIETESNEDVDQGDAPTQRIVTDRSAILLENVPARWRFVTIGVDGEDVAATDWFAAPAPGR